MVQALPHTGSNELARRLRKPTVKDPRLIVGVLLLAVSVWLGVWAVNDARGLSVAYVAKEALIVGQPVTQSDLEAVEVNLSSLGSAYLSAPLGDSETYFATQSVQPGSLVPQSALDTSLQYESRVLPISINSELPQEATVGTTVDLWSTPSKLDQGVQAEPVLVAESLVISQLAGSGGAFSSTRGQTVQVIVPDDIVSKVLAASAGSVELSLLVRPQGDL